MLKKQMSGQCHHLANHVRSPIVFILHIQPKLPYQLIYALRYKNGFKIRFQRSKIQELSLFNEYATKYETSTKVHISGKCQRLRCKITMTEQKISTSRSYELNSTVHLQNSDSRQLLIEQLEACNYTYQEFLLNPLQMGIPNSRLRYYLLVKKNANRDDPSMVLIVLTKVILGKSQAIDVYG
jgi:hypothetical protein